MNELVKRQIRTTFLLLLSIVLLIGTGLYLRWCNSFEVITTSANATAEDRADALKAYKTMADTEAAALRITSGSDVGERVELVFTGLMDVPEMQTLIDALLAQGRPAVFYISTMEAANYRQSVELLLENDFDIGLLGSGVNEALTAADAETLVEQLCRSLISLRSSFGVQCSSILSTARPDADALKAAAANHVREVIVAETTLALSECASADECAALIDAMPRGTVVRVSIARTEQDVAARLDNLFTAVEATDMLAAAEAELAALPADEELPEPMQRVYTTERAVCFTFAGMGNPEELTGVLAALDAAGSRAMFFVDYTELAEYGDDVRRILDAGHELGVKATSDLISSEAQILCELWLAEEALRTQYGYEGELMARAEHGKPGAALRRAAAAGGYTVVSNLMDPVQDSHIRLTDAMAVVEGILPEGRRTLQRGEIVHFRMNCYRNSDTLLGEVVTALLRERSIYPLKALRDVMNNDEFVYTYPLPQEEILPGVLDRIHAGQLTGDLMEVFPGRYIGTDWVCDRVTLPGFTDEEIALLDTAGLIANEEDKVFLTFDDWGTDAKTTKVLDILEKHGARATFFVTTGNVGSNPNLLRAIAEAGHAVASQTHDRIPLSDWDKASETYLPLKTEQLGALQADLVLSWQTLQSIIGDIEIDGRPALTPYFRAPKSSLSRGGVETVFDAGFTWIISGSCPTEDHLATDVESLLEVMAAGTQNGAVLSLRMTDGSIHTADALDLYLTTLAESSYRFVTVTEALGLD